ncbi:MAG TPA: hypothetical protein VMT76_01435 [Puia sp.]|nr:hypothetical protein [Puia sp.]
MNISIINGTFEPKDALDILSQFISVKIKFHEQKIHRSLNEEDIKMREKRIIELQDSLFQIRKLIQNDMQPVSLQCNLEILK